MENVIDQKAISSNSKCRSRREWFPNKTSLGKKTLKKKKKPTLKLAFLKKAAFSGDWKHAKKKKNQLCEVFCKDYSLQADLAALSALSPNAMEYNYVKSISKATPSVGAFLRFSRPREEAVR